MAIAPKQPFVQHIYVLGRKALIIRAVKFVRWYLLLGLLAGQICVSAYVSAKLPAGEIASLSDNIIEHGEKLVSASLSANTDPWDRRVILSQMSMLIFYGRGCDAVQSYLERTPELPPEAIDKIIYLSIMEGKTPCYPELAPLLLRRLDEEPNEHGHMVLRYTTGAALDLVGDPRGPQVMQSAEMALMKDASNSELWRARYAALNMYRAEPKRTNYVLYLASRVEDERPLLDDYKTILVELSRIGRCDIVERILNNGPKSCNAYKEFATAIASWTRQPEPVVEPSFTMLDGALTEPNPMIRMTKLIDLAKLCYKARYH